MAEGAMTKHYHGHDGAWPSIFLISLVPLEDIAALGSSYLENRIHTYPLLLVSASTHIRSTNLRVDVRG